MSRWPNHQPNQGSVDVLSPEARTESDWDFAHNPGHYLLESLMRRIEAWIYKWSTSGPVASFKRILTLRQYLCLGILQELGAEQSNARDLSIVRDSVPQPITQGWRLKYQLVFVPLVRDHPSYVTPDQRPPILCNCFFLAEGLQGHIGGDYYESIYQQSPSPEGSIQVYTNNSRNYTLSDGVHSFHSELV